MTALQRKQHSDAILTSRGIAPPPGLQPLAEEGLHLRDAEAVARRIMVLAYLIVIAESGEKASVVKFLQGEGLWSSLSAQERALVKKKVLGDKDKVALSWRIEAIWTLLWSLGQLPALDWPGRQCGIAEMLSHLPGFLCTAPGFYSNARLREGEELLDAADLYYRLHHVMQSAPSSLRYSGADPFIITERHAALQWVLNSSADWDEIAS